MDKYKINYRMQYSRNLPTNCGKENPENMCIRGPTGPISCVAMACVDEDIPQLFGPGINKFAIQIHVDYCNLNCKFCWAYPLRPTDNFTIERTPQGVYEDIKCKYDRIKDSGRNRRKDSPSTLIFSGLEPLAQSRKISEILGLVANDQQLKNMKILVRTNGIFAANPEVVQDLAKIRSLNLVVKFQVSLKGVNPQQFHWLTGCNPDLFQKQVEGYDNLSNIFGDDNVSFTLGIYHCRDGIRVNRKAPHKSFPLSIVDVNGHKMNFQDYDRNILKPNHIAKIEAGLHKQNLEFFTTTESDTKKQNKHNRERDQILEITCPENNKYHNLKDLKNCTLCQNNECIELKECITKIGVR